MNLGISKTVPMPFAQAVEKTTDELKKEGFGVLTKIDIQETLKQKLGADFKQYVILGACNPLFAYKALQTDESIGLLLPCNVVVYEKGKETVVSAFNPLIMESFIETSELGAIAKEIESRLRRVIEAV